MPAMDRTTGAPRPSRSLDAALIVYAWIALLSCASAAADEFSVTPTHLQFGAVYLGATAQMQVNIINVSGITQHPNFSGGAPFDSTNFGAGQNCAGATFPPGASCQFTYLFHPMSVGDHASATNIGINSVNYAITLTGIGSFPLSVAPLDLDFGIVEVGGIASRALLITNISGIVQTPSYSGGAPLDSTNFGGFQNCGGVNLPPGGGCQFTYQFHPVSPGAHVSGTTVGIDGVNFGIVLSGFAGSDLIFANGFD